MNRSQHIIQHDDESNSDSDKRTGIYLRRLWSIISFYSGLQEKDSRGYTVSKIENKKNGHTLPVTLAILKFVPSLLLILFITSIFIDLDGLSITLFGLNYPLDNFLVIISVSGLIGFLTNWLAIWMLFRPVEKRPLLGQGLIPAHKERISYRLALAVSEDLINPEIIKKKIDDSRTISVYREQMSFYMKDVIDNPDFRTDLKNWTVEYIDEMISDTQLRAKITDKIVEEIEIQLQNHSLEKAAIKVYSFLKGNELRKMIENSLERLPSFVELRLYRLDALLDILPAKIEENGPRIDTLITQLLFKLINQLDVQELVEENLNRYDENKLEQMIKGATNEQLTYIKYLGAVLGTTGGLVIWQPVLSMGFITLLILSVVCLDYILYKFIR